VHQRNPYRALPQMRLLTYRMPDELLAIASDGEFDEFDLNAFFEASGTAAADPVARASVALCVLNVFAPSS